MSKICCVCVRTHLEQHLVPDHTLNADARTLILPQSQLLRNLAAHLLHL